MSTGQELRVSDFSVDQFGNSRDLVLRLRQVDHSVFTRRNADLLISIKISLKDALLGFTLPVKHLDGRDIWIRSKKGQVTTFDDVLVVPGEG